MRKLALPEEVLLQIEQPARYIGNEFNSVVKDKEKVALRGAFLFPDVYEIGMSHLGIQILYDMFNKREDMWCERVYSPWPDLDRVMREQNIPLFGLESQESVKNEDFLFITLQYEMCYTNVLQALDLAGIPLHAVERTGEDPIVIGGGPAGYTAALYAARAGLSTLVLEKLSAGGQMALTEQIDNYPGFESGIDGFTLGEKMQQSAERFGAVTELAEVYKASLSGRIKTLDTSEGVFQSRTVVIATGATPRPLGIPGEEALVGKGVHYCAACDGAPYRGKTVAVVGGGNSAAADALTLSRIAKKVYLIHRRDSLRATKVYHEPLINAPNVEFCWNSTVSALLHDSRLTGLRLKDVNTGTEHDLACDGVFISVGRAPATELFRSELALDKSGYIIADESTRTNLPGVFAVGDVRTKALRQVVTAVSDGAVAVHYAEEYLAENR